MLHKLSDDTFIRSQSLSRNTTFQALPFWTENFKIKLPDKLDIWEGANQELLNEIGQFLAKYGFKFKEITNLE